MQNISEIRDRLELVRQYTGLKEADFADKIEIGRATLSSMFKGRNNPTLPVVLNVLEKYRNISPVWLLHGEGTMLMAKRSDETPSGTPIQGDIFAMQEHNQTQSIERAVSRAVEPVLQLLAEQTECEQPAPRTITEIRVFYNDNTYDTFTRNP